MGDLSVFLLIYSHLAFDTECHRTHGRVLNELWKWEQFLLHYVREWSHFSFLSNEHMIILNSRFLVVLCCGHFTILDNVWEWYCEDLKTVEIHSFKIQEIPEKGTNVTKTGTQASVPKTTFQKFKFSISALVPEVTKEMSFCILNMWWPLSKPAVNR